MFKPTYFFFFILILTILGCDSSSDQIFHPNIGEGPADQSQETTKKVTEQPSLENTAVEDHAIAKLSGQTVSMEEIDDIIKLRLFDLEWRKYELRRSVLQTKIEQHLKSIDQSKTNAPDSIEIFLTPPTPPKFVFPVDQRPVKGKHYAKIAVAVFCSYQSSHCARLQPVLKELELHYKDLINFRFYDFPQSFHRYAKSAANAVYCAAEFSTPWDFQSAIYADINQLNNERYLAIAEQLGFDKASFSSCLTEHRYNNLIAADIKLGQQFGLGNVPVLFINGLYVKGPQTVEGFSYYIDQELSQIGELKPKLSSLPIQLFATSISNKPEESTAIVEFLNTGDIRTYATGESLNENVRLVRIEEKRIIVDHRGQLEFIMLKSSYEAQPIENYAANTFESVEIEATDTERSYDKEPSKKYRELKPTGEMALSRQWLEDQLEHQKELEVFFYAAEHEVDGVHLLKLKDVETQEFYKMLGLRTGDVVLRVNEEFVHDAHNPLWENLQNENAVKLLVMRKGFPVRYDYKIK